MGLGLRRSPVPGDTRGCRWRSSEDVLTLPGGSLLEGGLFAWHSRTEPQIHTEHEDGDPPPTAQGARAAACRVRRAVRERRAPPPPHLRSAKRSSP